MPLAVEWCLHGTETNMLIGGAVFERLAVCAQTPREWSASITNFTRVRRTARPLRSAHLMRWMLIINRTQYIRPNAALYFRATAVPLCHVFERFMRTGETCKSARSDEDEQSLPPFSRKWTLY